MGHEKPTRTKRGVPGIKSVWLPGLCSLAAVGLWAAPAQAITFTQRTVPFSGLVDPVGVAVDSAGDVFAGDLNTRQVLKLQPDGSQRTLPFNGLFDPEALAVDSAGNVFVADGFNKRVVEMLASDTKQQRTCRSPA